jgi:hypothetical protein
VAEDVYDVEVDWAALPEGWERINPRLTLVGEGLSAHANRVRAYLAEGLVAEDQVEGLLRFAAWLEERT